MPIQSGEPWLVVVVDSIGMGIRMSSTVSEKWNKLFVKRLVSHNLADFIVCTTRVCRNELVLTLVRSLLLSVSLCQVHHFLL